ncbi:MAG TPA: 16S rRNA (adenine(1518)-N(6)/adenine(1519)-N(6))-dimethyltransferase [Alphaproteobacteria bacterium]|nr:16S rRNA (adenine(1518)-N(6)/adenine(1519)-N(6))-dimethyltransferase [Alphaproteobacteria bacterium]
MLLQADKSLGQNFLTDGNILDKIARSVRAKKGDTAIEIGPGQGALTRKMLEKGVNIIAVEYDERFIPLLNDLNNQGYEGKIEVHHADVLKTDLTKLIDKKVPLIGNLPYNIGTEIIFGSIRNPESFSQMLFLLQKEVVERITATVDDRHWGRLGLMCQQYADTAYLFDVPPTAFIPAPKVMSSIVELNLLEKPRFDIEHKKLERVIKTAFVKRRKMLRASLKGTLNQDQIQTAGVEPTERPENLTLSDFVNLAKQL